MGELYIPGHGDCLHTTRCWLCSKQQGTITVFAIVLACCWYNTTEYMTIEPWTSQRKETLRICFCQSHNGKADAIRTRLLISSVRHVISVGGWLPSILRHMHWDLYMIARVFFHSFLTSSLSDRAAANSLHLPWHAVNCFEVMSQACLHTASRKCLYNASTTMKILGTTTTHHRWGCC